MRDAQPRAVYLSDYRVPDFLIDSTELHFLLGDERTRVESRLALRRNPESGESGAALRLDGAELTLGEVKLDGRPLATDDYQVTPDQLIIPQVPDQFVLEVETWLRPQENTSLEGLYLSNGMFCTQCEAEGFRKITYYLDRPDVMSVYTVTLEADRERFPVLLSNGNRVADGVSDGNRHYATWHDPFRKPAYLFALVAGDLAHIEDHFETMGGRQVMLRIYVELKDLDKCDHAMASLKRAMRWDEEVYGREYDLDIFNIVAVDDFNMGAMENKSLNIFNTSCVLARPETTTDAGFQRVEAVVAHEYFHNWSGNRVTCRDWFQLSLKEGFTVFRDAAFSADMGSPTVKRVEDVTLLRTQQFAEDAGPMAHPVRPDTYMEISNFYTLTIYEKGAEVVRMLHRLLGPDLFRRGSDLYFDRHDGEAVTCDDFVRAMEEASGRDLTQFRRWYSQAGTPVLDVEGHYDADRRCYELTVRQSCLPSPGQSVKEPYHLPLAMALLGTAGPLPLQCSAAGISDAGECVLNVTEAEQLFVFEQVEEAPVPSLLRGFSAPVRLRFPYSRADLLFLMQHDDDGFSRWDAGQTLVQRTLEEMISSVRRGEAIPFADDVTEAFRALLRDRSLDPAMVALMLALPSEAYLIENAAVVDFQAIHAARETAREQLGRSLEDELWTRYRECAGTESYAPTAEQIARRSLRNTCLGYLMKGESEAAVAACVEQFERSDNMTETLAALVTLVNSSQVQARERALAAFYDRWQHEPLVVNLWLQVQAGCQRPQTLELVRQLMLHPAFDIRNPNKVRALIGAFANQNLINFHANDGSGYRFLADQVIFLDQVNPQIASRLAAPLSKWKRTPEAAQQQMIEQLRRIEVQPELSPDVCEVVVKSLAQAGWQ